MLPFHFFFLLPLTLLSAPIDFKSCQLKYQVSSIAIGKTQAFAVEGEYALYYSQQEPSGEVIKRDPFLGLNLIKAPKPFKHIFKFYNNDPKELAAILPNRVHEGRIVSEQVGLNTLGKFSKNVEENSLIGGTCCGIIGLATPQGIIDKQYIRHFLESKEVVYADIGIRLADKGGTRVIEVNPFFEGSPFLLNDMIVSMDTKKIKNAAQLSRDILFASPGSKHAFVLIREGKELKLDAVFQKRLSGGLVPDSFFDLFGLMLDENLIVKEDNGRYEIKKSDRLLSVMGKEVKSLADIRHLLSVEKSSSSKMIVLLFRRNGFDFFIHFSKP
jgi:PDZ domain-containing protein